MNYDFRYQQLKTVEERLRKESWFVDGWDIHVVKWPNEEAPTCVAIQLFKHNWFNHDQCGLHFETWLLDTPIESQQIPVLMHVLHRKDFPNGQKANAFAKPFVEDVDVQKTVRSWGKYKLGKGGMTPFRANMKFAEETVEESLFKEFCKLQTLGSKADEYLSVALS